MDPQAFGQVDGFGLGCRFRLGALFGTYSESFVLSKRLRMVASPVDHDYQRTRPPLARK